MSQARLISGFAAIVLAASSTYSLAAPDVYRWVDEQGVVHFSEQPPANIEADKVNIQPDDSAGLGNATLPLPTNDSAGAGAEEKPVNPAEQEREERAQARRDAADKRSETEVRCKRANDLVAQLEPFPRVMTRNKDGEMIRMDDNDRLKKLGAAKDYVKANCSK